MVEWILLALAGRASPRFERIGQIEENSRALILIASICARTPRAKSRSSQGLAERWWQEGRIDSHDAPPFGRDAYGKPLEQSSRDTLSPKLAPNKNKKNSSKALPSGVFSKGCRGAERSAFLVLDKSTNPFASFKTALY